MLFEQDGKLVYRYGGETVVVEAWHDNALRVRSTMYPKLPDEDWALSQPRPAHAAAPVVRVDGAAGSKAGGTITNGKIKATVSASGKLIVTDARTGKVLLEEYQRRRDDPTDPKASAILVDAREFAPIAGGDFAVTARFESQDVDERIYGMGQYQQPNLDLKGCDLELAQRNSQASVPFALSSRGYGFLWNSPSVGRAVFGRNVMSFESRSSRALDYWVVAGDSPRDIAQAYAAATGTVPMMPEYGLGFWQCKLRYQTQQELLEVARKHRGLGLPMDVIVVDFFHWPTQGDWRFDPTYFPDPKAMVDELREMGVELMVSIWPTIDVRSESYAEMRERGLLVRAERGIATQLDFCGQTQMADFTSPEARRYVWAKCKRNYADLGVKVFWLDEAEPEYAVYSFDNYRYHDGPLLAVGNRYPVCYSQAFYEGQQAEGQRDVVNLVRCAWAGSQRYGSLVWSGDIASSWGSFRNQLAAGLNMGMAGIPWWTTDAGGFHGGDPNDEGFRELLVRWFQWAAFCPVMRLHGDREPKQPQYGTTGGAECLSGAPNEVWSYGEANFVILKKYLLIREALRDYTRELMRQAHERGWPVMRTCFFEFPDDAEAWKVEDAYMYGHRFLVAPILEAGQTKRRVYLPAGARWKRFRGGAAQSEAEDGGEAWHGGETVEVDAPIDDMPVFERLP
ncbi:uncharacterized protein PFL1_03996 [Pseudozyma flocculosa PF-1]|uniref:Glycoside hydrolase family 31 N-terminal domain-containing protein n=2 Tax=Pseudozyma flocculosa TaxID=84751 RepID=A0A061H7S4_9BASI|nr:uncharacterized protein PFL1_03996 [Pseudozyma flocculosa PF-1]EPQ28693.1 hypothetical protein PFL1_03996 [Pseudozyma flocculosa PF-1]SPO36649.1 probable alpha-glucosidase 2 [Pseudozyma flocculosa]